MKKVNILDLQDLRLFEAEIMLAEIRKNGWPIDRQNASFKIDTKNNSSLLLSNGKETVYFSTVLNGFKPYKAWEWKLNKW